MQLRKKKKCPPVIIVTFLLFFVAGCKDERELDGYYDAYLHNDTYPVGAYRFFKDGRCFYYKYNRSTNERYPFDFDDVTPINTWSSHNDTLIIMGYGYEVVNVSSDTLMLKAFNKSKDKMLVMSKRQKDE